MDSSTALGGPPGLVFTDAAATKVSQLEDNLAALDFEIPVALSQKLDEVSRPETVVPYLFFSPGMQRAMTGGVPVLAEPRWFRSR